MKFTNAWGEVVGHGAYITRESKSEIYHMQDGGLVYYERIGIHAGHPVIGSDQPIHIGVFDVEDMLANDWVVFTGLSEALDSKG